MLLENLLQLDIKRRALELQRMLLERPYGDYMTVELESMAWRDAFAGSNGPKPGTMNEDVIVLHVNDQFDDDRVDPYGPNGVRVVMTPGAVYISGYGDGDHSQFSTYNGSYLHGSIFDNSVVNRVLKFFVLEANSIRDSFFDTKQADEAIKDGLTLSVGKNEPTFFRYKDGLTSVKIEANQLILVKTLHVVIIIKALALYVKKHPTDEEYSSMREMYNAYNVTSLTRLLQAANKKHGSHKIYLTFEDPVSGVRGELDCRLQGATASWFYDYDRCSIALMERLT